MRVSVAHLNDYNFFLTTKKDKKVKPKKRPKTKKKKKKKQKKRKNKKKKKKKKKNEGPAHLDLNPPHFSFVVLFPFLSLLPIDQKPCFSPRKGHFMFVFACLPLFSLSLFWPPPFFHFLFLCFSLFFFLSSFLSFFFVLFSFLVFVCFFCLFFLLCFCFMKRTTSKYSITKFSFINIFSILVSCLVFSSKSFFPIFVFLILSCVFVQHQVADQRKA